MTRTSYKLFFKAFSNETRFNILQLLRKKSLTVTEISEKLAYEQSRVSHNLKCLEHCGFVSATQNGKQRIYCLNTETVGPLMTFLDKHITNNKAQLSSCEVIKK